MTEAMTGAIALFLYMTKLSSGGLTDLPQSPGIPLAVEYCEAVFEPDLRWGSFYYVQKYQITLMYT